MRAGLFLILLALFGAPDLSLAEKQKFIEENALLDAELKLAKKPDIYFIFNLEQKNIQIKARGVILRELPLIYADYFGNRIFSKPHILLKKRTIFKPGREKINPGRNKEDDNFQIDALELRDMPVRYRLLTDGGASIAVRPKTDGILSALCNIPYAVKTALSVPLHALWNFLRKRPHTAVSIVLEHADAQALYWSTAEGSGIVIYPSSSR